MAASVLFETRSTNGRWGVQIVGEIQLPDEERFDARPRQGRLEALGRRGGLQCFRFVAVAGDQWVVVGDGLVPVEGAGSVLVHSEDLQSNSSCVLLHVRGGGLYRWVGYKGRSSGYTQLVGGSTSEAPAGLLLEAGIIEPVEGSVKEAPEAPPFNAAFAAALKR